MPKDEDVNLKYICVILFLLFILCFLIINSFKEHYIGKGEIIGIAILGLAIFALVYNAIYKTFIKRKK